jgi:membrane-bound inhibitor of C-type lysozyme
VADVVFQTKEIARSRVPPNSVEYRCDAGKGFFLRTADSGASAWVILPEREFRLDRTGGAAGSRYENRVARLELNGEQATLTDGPDTFSGCKLTRDEK